LPTQRHVVCELNQLHDTIVREQLASPSVIVIGDVFKGLMQLDANQTNAVQSA
jgi:uroporphyrin-III C-methyltransferase